MSVAGVTTDTLTCDLVDPSGTVRISAAQEFVRTAPGTTAATLLFDNGAIGVPGVFGPWKVENLQLFEQRDGRAERRAVSVTDAVGGEATLSAGVAAGERVIIGAPTEVADGVAVEEKEL